MCLFVPSHLGGSGSSSTPWIATGKTGEQGGTAAVFRGGFGLEGFTFGFETPAFGFFVGFFRLLMLIFKEPLIQVPNFPG